MITVFTIPLVVGSSMAHFIGDQAAIRRPFGKSMIQLMIAIFGRKTKARAA